MCLLSELAYNYNGLHHRIHYFCISLKVSVCGVCVFVGGGGGGGVNGLITGSTTDNIVTIMYVKPFYQCNACLKISHYYLQILRLLHMCTCVKWMAYNIQNDICPFHLFNKLLSVLLHAL